jgi:hypothetical protein
MKSLNTRLIKNILQTIAGIALMYALTVFFAGCPSPKPVQHEELPPPPPEPAREFFITVGSVDLSSFPRKIEKSDIRKFTSQVKKDSLDILTLQGITRYPDLKDRIDIVDELSATTEMAAAFGETMTLTGRQSGNGIFSYYPIKSHESTSYTRLRSTRFESALQAIIDCGERELVIVSTQLPEKISLDEQSVIASTLGGFTIFYINRPMIISGNLLLSKTMRSLTSYNVVENEKDKSLPKFWYSNDGSLRVKYSKTTETALGRMLCVRFNLSPPLQP